jgi:hypothetical protein
LLAATTPHNGEQIDLEFDWMVSLGGRWKFWIWYQLLSGPKRFSELQKLLPPISQQVLTLERNATRVPLLNGA